MTDARNDKSSVESPSYASLQRISKFLLTLAAVLMATVIVLAVYLFWERERITALESSLLAEQELQEQLLAGQDSDYAFSPHLDPELSYVLNPAMQESTWRAAQDDHYGINRMGLRGPNIGPKPTGVKRVALVGDSVLFGWKINHEAMLATQMQAIVDQRLGPGRYEFITVALPGWNTRDQDRFLRNHLGTLNPDYVIWSLLRNDIEDSAGVIPPGILAGWNAPQKTGQQAFRFAASGRNLRDAPAHSILSRWKTNIQLIKEFGEDHQVPLGVLWWRSRHRALFEFILSGMEVELPVIHVPGQYRYDPDSWCVAFPDCHPTPWANRLLAVGLLNELVTQGAMPGLVWSSEEKEIIEAFRMEAERSISPEDQRSFMAMQAAAIPERYSPDTDSPALFGIRGGNMARNGVMLLRLEGGASDLKMEIARPVVRRGPALEIEISIRGDQGPMTRAVGTLTEATNQLVIALPDSTAFDLYEIEWKFSYVECENPSACYAAELRDARLVNSRPRPIRNARSD